VVWVVSLLAVKLSPHGLTAMEHVTGIRSLVGVSKLVGPLAHPELYLRHTTITLALELFRGEPAISRFV
jgi:hypothetical protein